MRDVSGALARQSLLVAGVCVVVDTGKFLYFGGQPTHWAAWTVLIATAVVDAALAVPPRWAGAVAVGHAVVLVLPVLLPGHIVPGANGAGLLLAGYRAGAWLRKGQAVGALVVLMGASAIWSVIEDADWQLVTLNPLLNGFLPWLVGRHTTARRGHIADLEQREAEAVRRALAEERSAIARDLHDVISHHVSAIGMHAGAGRLALGGGDGAVLRALIAVESASRAAMADLRRLLDLLHGQNEDTRQPGLEDLGELLNGLPARLLVHGKRRELAGSLDITLYRIAQEAVTNALRHGDGGIVDVELAYRDNEISLTVTNTMPPAEQPGQRPAGASGLTEPAAHDAKTAVLEKRSVERRHGLTGIQQRVALYGGRLSYGPEGGKWRIQAAFPIEESLKCHAKPVTK